MVLIAAIIETEEGRLVKRSLPVQRSRLEIIFDLKPFEKRVDFSQNPTAIW